MFCQVLTIDACGQALNNNNNRIFVVAMVNKHRFGRSCPARISLLITACSILRNDALGFHPSGAPGAASRTALNVLSPRQLQFWEDVEGKEICAGHCAKNHSEISTLYTLIK
jgi:hypothetical protein